MSGKGLKLSLDLWTICTAHTHIWYGKHEHERNNTTKRPDISISFPSDLNSKKLTQHNRSVPTVTRTSRKPNCVESAKRPPLNFGHFARYDKPKRITRQNPHNPLRIHRFPNPTRAGRGAGRGGSPVPVIRRPNYGNDGRGDDGGWHLRYEHLLAPQQCKQNVF